MLQLLPSHNSKEYSGQVLYAASGFNHLSEPSHVHLRNIVISVHVLSYRKHSAWRN